MNARFQEDYRATKLRIKEEKKRHLELLITDKRQKT